MTRSAPASAQRSHGGGAVSGSACDSQVAEPFRLEQRDASGPPAGIIEATGEFGLGQRQAGQVDAGSRVAEILGQDRE